MNSSHARFMQRALKLAARGKGRVSPNPCVGCVVVKNGKIVGKGFHERFGGPHAEVLALKQAGKRARGSVIYINLEPCNHWGKTPPCAPQLVAAGVRKVFIAMEDPNPLVSGKGIKTLKRAGIQVEVGLESRAAAYLNRSFVTWMTKKRPHLVLKMAMTLDGKIATSKGESKWISSPQSRKWVHRLRSESDAVLIGVHTANQDNPSLTSHGLGRNPIRIVIDPHGRARKNLQLFKTSSARTLLVTGKAIAPQKGIQILRLSLRFKRIDLVKVMNNISKMNVSHVLIEGGGETSWSFIESGLVDEVYFFIAPKLLGGREALTPIEGKGFSRIADALSLKDMTFSRVGPDFVVHAMAARP